MAFSRQELKVVSIIQLIMVAIFLALGLVDHFEVRYMYASFTLMPCWIAALVLPVGVMGLVLAKMSGYSSTLANALMSVSMAGAAVSAFTVMHYHWALTNVVIHRFPINYQEEPDGYRFLVAKDIKIKYNDEEKTMIAIHSLVIMFSIFEIILAVASARSSYAEHTLPQGNQADVVYRQLEAGQIPIQLQNYFPPQNMVAIPVSSATYGGSVIQ